MAKGIGFVILPQRPGHRAPESEVMRGIDAAGDEAYSGWAPDRYQRGIYGYCAAILWTHRARNQSFIDGVRKIGGQAIVMENGYIGGRQYFSWGFDGYNGAGRHLNSDSPSDRWRSLELPIEPWRKDGRHILICLQRGLGPKAFSHDADWLDRTIAELRRHTDRPIIVRPHPLAMRYQTFEGCGLSWKQSLADACRNAWATVTYRSTSVIECLRLGVPAFVTAPDPAMASPLARSDLSEIEHPAYPERDQFFHDLAYAQWNYQEIADGSAWRHLMHGARDD